jgi:ABC-type cobalamin/Fe3+-siderophores transport system ATPase subunit
MLEVITLSANYGDTPILKDVNLQAAPGEILAVIGPNGAGKTTLIRAISGTHPVQAGKIFINGQDLLLLSPQNKARLMAVVPQAHHLPEDFSVRETVLLGRTPYLNWLGSAGEKDHAIVQSALELTQLTQLANRRVGELSGGEQQLVLLARALAQDAPILLLDEPTTYLDLQHQSMLLNLVRKMAVEKRLAVLMVLHDLNLAGMFADRVVLLVRGTVYAAGLPGEVITAENLAEIYHIPISVIAHPEYGTPLVLPDGRNGVRP